MNEVTFVITSRLALSEEQVDRLQELLSELVGQMVGEHSIDSCMDFNRNVEET